MSPECVILFYSTNYAVWTADLLKENSIKNSMVPVPRELSSDCGYCIKIDKKDEEKVLKILEENSIEYDRTADI